MTRFALLALLVLAGCRKSSERVVVYCAQDPEYAEQLFKEFAAETGVEVVPKYDTEANKSVGLALELERERERPRAGLHWNNEVVGTVRLAELGVYAPCDVSDIGYPAGTSGPSHLYQQFAARVRVLLVNTNLVPEAERPRTLLELAGPKWKGKVALAKPLFGTTATQAAALAEVLGTPRMEAFYRALSANGARVVAGNKQSARAVSDGTAAVGLTDSDDALEELADGKPVAVVIPDLAPDAANPKLGPLVIPNTLALVKGGPNPAGSERLMRYLLRPESEAKLAAGPGKQLPLHPRAAGSSPPALKALTGTKLAAVDWANAAKLWEPTQAFLRGEFAR